MASAEREPITGVWGHSPQRGPGAEPLVGVRGRSPPEAELAGSRGRAPGEGSGGEALLKLKAFQFLDVKRWQQICTFLAFWELGLAQCTW